MEQEQNTQIARDIAEVTGPCVEHTSVAAVAKVRRVSGSYRFENVCAACFDVFVIARYPRSGRAAQARARVAQAQDDGARAAARRKYIESPESSVLVAPWADICEADGKFFNKADARLVGGTTYCAEHAMAYFLDVAALDNGGAR